MPKPIEAMRVVAKRLEPLNIRFAFLGGAVVSVLVDDPELTEIRPTKDVDIVVEIVTLSDFYQMETRLREHGFRHDTSAGAPICRWIVEGCVVDVMPVDGSMLGMNSKWFREALELSTSKNLGGGCTARCVSPPLFLATKLAAFNDRAHGDFYASHDLEDIVTLIDGRAGIVEEVAASPSDVCNYIVGELGRFLKEPDFRDAFPGHLSAITGARGRAKLTFERVERIAAFS